MTLNPNRFAGIRQDREDVNWDDVARRIKNESDTAERCVSIRDRVCEGVPDDVRRQNLRPVFVALA